MALSNQELAIIIRARDEASRALALVNRQVSQLGTHAHGTSKAMSHMGGAAHGATMDIQGLTSHMAVMMASMAVLSAIQLAFGAAMEAGIGFNAMLEQSDVAWSNMLQSASASSYVLDLLKQFAAVTPFEFPELEKDVRLLTSFGFAVNDILSKGPKGFQGLAVDIGNAAAFGGRGAEAIKGITVALGSMKMAGRVNAQDMMQMINAGVPAWDMLAKYIGKSVSETRKLSDEGKISGETMVKAFQAWAQTPQVGNMMKAQSRTFLGVISTIKDNLRMGLGDAFQPVFARLANLSRAFADATTGGGFTAAMKQIAGVISGLLALLDRVPTPVRNAALVFAALAAAAVTLAPILGVVAAAFAVLTGPVGIVIGLLTALYLAWQTNFLGIRDVVGAVLPQVLDVVVTIIGGVLDFFEQNLPKVVEIAERVWTWLKDVWDRYGRDLVKIAETILGWVYERFVTALDTLSEFISLILNIIKGNWQGALGNLSTIFANVWKSVVNTLRDAAKVIVGVLRIVFRAFGREDMIGAWESEIDRAADAARTLGAGVAYAAEELDRYGDAGARAERITSTGRSKVLGWADALRSALTPATKSAWQQFRQAETEWNNAQAALDRNKKAADAMAGAAGNLGKQAKAAGLNVSDLVSALVATHPATLKAAAAVKYWESQVAAVNLAIKANQDQLKAAQAELGRMQERLDGLNAQLAEAQKRMEEFSRPRLRGMGELEGQIAAVEAQLKRLQLAQLLGLPLEEVIRQYPLLTAGAEDYLSTLPQSREELEKILEMLRLQQSLGFDEKMRLLEQASKRAVKEMDFDEAMAGVIRTKAEIESLTAAIGAQEAAMQAQQKVVAAIQAEGERLNDTLESYQTQLKRSQTDLAALTEGLRLAYTWFLQDRDKLIEMGGAAAAQAALIDERTREFLASLSGYVEGNTGSAVKSVDDMLAAYKADVDLILKELAKLEKTVVTVHEIRTVYTTAGSPGAGGGGGAPAMAAGGVAYGPTLALIGERGPEAVVPLSGGGVIDYNKLARALASQPVIVEVDGQAIARVTRGQLLKTQSRNGDLWR